MAKVCEICGKGNISGHNITHSDKKIKRTWKPNIQKIKIVDNGTAKRINVCTSCMKSNKVQR